MFPRVLAVAVRSTCRLPMCGLPASRSAFVATRHGSDAAFPVQPCRLPSDRRRTAAAPSLQTRPFSSSRVSLAAESSVPPPDPQNDPGNILRRLAESPSAMASITKLMAVIKEEGGIDFGKVVRPDGTMDQDAMPKRPSMFEMARLMMNGKIRDAVKEVHAELQKAGIELTPERVSAILQADELIRGLKK